MDCNRHLKHRELFAVLDNRGWADPVPDQAGSGPLGRRIQGIYRRDTRYLDTWRLRVDGQEPHTLSIAQPDPFRLRIVQADPALTSTMAYSLEREVTLDGRSCRESVRLTNTTGEPARHRLDLDLRATFEDIFEARGTPLPALSGRRVEVRPGERAYSGRDGLPRRAVVEASSGPPEGPWAMDLAPGESFTLTITLHLLERDEPPAAHSSGDVDRQYREWRRRRPAGAGRLDRVVEQAWDDLQALLLDGPDGLYPAAGVPRFVNLFGRDTLIAGLFMVRHAPELARSILLNLARLQGREEVAAREEQPGKIVHEVRTGEAATLGLVPFARYYGTVDATPLFLCLAGDYLRVTGDQETARSLWPHARAAAAWMKVYGDVDGDGLLEFVPAGGGLVNQGWKDSFDSSAHRDGTLADAPIALAEVQGYTHRAWQEFAVLAAAAGDEPASREAARSAELTRQRFEEAFWLPGRGCYAMALDRDKRPLDVVASNQGHCLWAGIVAPDRAGQVAEVLMTPEVFTGWGLRTLAPGAARYNPVSYHNGSVWPHDSALAAAGFARYGLLDHARALTTGILESGLALPDHRLPELYAGFPRERGVPPVGYPQASVPQAWAAAAAIFLAGLLAELDR